MKLFNTIVPAVFLSRPNRFVVLCRTGGRAVRAYLPNPGRLWELLLPNAKLLLTILPPDAHRKLTHLVVAVERDGTPVMLHTHHNNLVARHLIESGRAPGFEGAEIVQAEYRVGSSRFDFLLRKDGRDLLVEVKSCTLFHDTLAMFPDAISSRATKHLLELASLSNEGYKTAVLFVVHSLRARWFMPEHHTDLTFCRTLLQVKDRVTVKAVSVGWNDDMSLGNDVRELTVPWDLVERESHDRGSYLILLQLMRDRRLEIGGLGKMLFRKGYYLYIGSAMQDLTRRIERHKLVTKKKHRHIDHLREHARFIAGIPIRSSDDREREISASLRRIADWSVPGFGSTDCHCVSHLVGMSGDPLRRPEFVSTLLDLRMGKLEKELKRTLR